MRIFASDRVKTFMQALGMERGEAIEHRMVTNAIEKAQRKVEGRNFDIRKQLLEYDDVANDQRQVVYTQRNDLLETDDMKCKIGSLRILRDITIHPQIRKKLTNMGGIELLIKILGDPDADLQLLAAETMANIAKYRSARTIVRKNNGIPKLIDLLDIDVSKVSS